MVSLSAAETLAVLLAAQMRPFERGDYSAFSGIESAHPMIGEASGMTVILDGEELEIYDAGGELAFACTISIQVRS